MAFQMYRVPPPTAPGSSAFFRFDELSGVDPGTGQTTMHLAVVALGNGCSPPGPPDQSIALRVGVEAPTTLVPGTAVRVVGPAGPVGLATLSGAGVLLVEIEVLESGGDWQILLWLFPFVPTRRGIKRNWFPLISRWKILDNLRRSLVAPMLLALLVAGWIALPGTQWFWTATVLVVMVAFVLGGVIVILPVTTIYSYVVWKHDKNRAGQ